MCVRPACYIPSTEPTLRDVAETLVARRNLATAAELGAIALFLCAVFIWCAIGTGVA